MPNTYQDDEIIIDFTKTLKIFEYRKKLIMQIFAAGLVFFILFALILPKKYESSAHLYVNKSNNTNLTELNPYIIASASSMGSGFNLSSSNVGLQNEIEIMKSPLVMDSVIKENDLRYNKGKKKGEFITTKAFLEENIDIFNKKDTSLIVVSYTSVDPKLSYNIVNSIIKNYQRVNEEINTKKAMQDKALLENSYSNSTKVLNEKLEKIKDAHLVPVSSMNNLGPLAVLRDHDKSISSTMDELQNQALKGRKSQFEIDQEIDKLKLVKSKLEWSNLVEDIARNSTNIIVLKQPELKRDFENSEPKLLINFILIMFLAICASIVGVFFRESIDNTLTYSILKEQIVYDIKKNIEELKLLLLTNQDFDILLIKFEGFEDSILEEFKSYKNLKVVEAGIDSKLISQVNKVDKIILAGKIGETPKKLYFQVKEICNEADKEICSELV